jgi:hypothetical protein
MVTAPSFCDLPTVKDLFFGSLGVDYFGFFSQWGYPLSQKQATTLGRRHLLARRDRKAQNFID